jgi:hypothetical protein
MMLPAPGVRPLAFALYPVKPIPAITSPADAIAVDARHHTLIAVVTHPAIKACALVGRRAYPIDAAVHTQRA